MKNLEDRASGGAARGHGSRPVFGVVLPRLTQNEVINGLLAPCEIGAGPQMLATINTDHVVNLRRDFRFREAYQFASHVSVDGAPVLVYARLLGVDIPARVTGADIFDRLLKLWEPSAHRLFFVVATKQAEVATRRLLEQRGFSPSGMAFCVPSYGFDCNIKLSRELADSIRDFAPTHVVMALGSPKSEIWIHQHSAKLGDCHVLCVGAAVEFSLGLKKRAPSWVRATGFEWLFRFATEPRRLFRRYFWDSFGFFAAILTDLRTRGTSVV